VLTRYSGGERIFHGVNLRGAELTGVDLSGASLSGDLSGSNLSCSRFMKATLSGNFSGANLERADLSHTGFGQAVFSNCQASGAIFEHAIFSGKVRFDEAILAGARFGRAFLPGVSFRKAKLNSANFNRANMEGVQLVQADLSGATLLGASLLSTNLTSANLTSADLRGAHFFATELTAVIGSHAILGGTTFGAMDLRGLRDIASIEHKGPSSIGIDTLYMSHGELPELFMRGCGLPDDLITYARSLTQRPIEFHSCFISYSTKNQDFAERLYADLQNAGIRCWYAPKDLKTGDLYPEQIEASIKVFDKVLLILSENSVSSDWVAREVNIAIEKEKERHTAVLFPVKIDEAVRDSPTQWAREIQERRQIGDFKSWKEHDLYRQAFDVLVSDLKKSIR